MLRLGDTPTKQQLSLLELPRLGISIRIKDKIVDYNSVGTCLLNDNDGATMKRIERDRRYTDDILGEVFDHWIRQEYQAGEENSNTWQVLVKCLRSVQMNALADEIEGVLQHCTESSDKNCRHQKSESQSTSCEVPRIEISHVLLLSAIISGTLAVYIYKYHVRKPGNTMDFNRLPHTN